MQQIDRRKFLVSGAIAGAAAISSNAVAQPVRSAVPGNTAKVLGPVLPAQSSWTAAPPLKAGIDKILDVNGAKLWCWDTGGSGEPIVLLHPATGSARIWGYQQSAFAERGYRVIAYSRRGHAGSDAGQAGSPGTAVDDLNRLLDILGVSKFHLVGSAAGAFAIPEYALTSGERLLSCVIASSQAGVAEPSYRAGISAITPAPFPQMPSSFRELGPNYRAANPEGVKAWEDLEHNSRSVPTRIRQESKVQVTFATLSAIKTPTLMFTGSADLYIPPALMAQVASRIPGAEGAIISDAGHSAYWEQPLAFNKLVLDFVRRHGRKG